MPAKIFKVVLFVKVECSREIIDYIVITGVVELYLDQPKAFQGR